ncbi:MAG: hypothetical protein PUF50_06280 [Erysipelotrichaceae bacterium]|nr:hypothetical protein [Erysipelotrichaceae bacterium]
MLETVNEVLNQCLPILTTIVFVLLILVFIRLLIVLNHVDQMTKKLNGTVDIINDYLTEMKVPVRVLVNVSMSIEALRAASEDTIRRFADSLSESFKALSDFFKKLWESVSQIKKETEPSNEVELVTIDQSEK